MVTVSVDLCVECIRGFGSYVLYKSTFYLHLVFEC